MTNLHYSALLILFNVVNFSCCVPVVSKGSIIDICFYLKEFPI